MTKNQKKISRNGKGSGLAKKRFRLYESKDAFETIVLFAFITMLFVSSIALSTINLDAYTQVSEVDQPGKQSEIDAEEDNSTDRLSSEEEEEGDRTININDAMLKESTTGSLEDKSDVDGTQLIERDKLQVNHRGNTTISQESDNTISLLKTGDRQ